jgi:hypothetical protein
VRLIISFADVRMFDSGRRARNGNHAQTFGTTSPHSRPRSLSADSDAVPAEKLLLRVIQPAHIQSRPRCRHNTRPGIPTSMEHQGRPPDTQPGGRASTRPCMTKPTTNQVATNCTP